MKLKGTKKRLHCRSSVSFLLPASPGRLGFDRKQFFMVKATLEGFDVYS
jgi:hypothetical protein